MTLKLSAQMHAHPVDSLVQPVLLMPAKEAASAPHSVDPLMLRQQNARSVPRVWGDAALCLGRRSPSALTQSLI